MNTSPNVLKGTERRISSRIVGGTYALPGSWPFTAYIIQSYKGRYKISNKDYIISYSWTCGATLINPKTLLTAGHCIHFRYFEHLDQQTNLVYLLKIEPNEWYPTLESTIDVYLGVYDLKKDLTNSKKHLHKVKRVILHEGFDETTLKNDIAAIQLNDYVTATNQINYACLPHHKSHTFPEPFKLQAYIVGWGRTSEEGQASNLLKNSRVFILGKEECIDVEYAVPKSWETQVCAGWYLVLSCLI